MAKHLRRSWTSRILRIGIAIGVAALGAPSHAKAQPLTQPAPLVEAAPAATPSSSDNALPLWEVGALLIGGWFPDYPAANQSHLHFLPIPYAVYRGSAFQLSSTSARGIVYRTPIISFDFSVSGAFPSNNNNAARRGMPNLDYTLQLGPQMNVLVDQLRSGAKIDFELPLRTVLSTDLSSLAFRGFILAPELDYSDDNFLRPHAELKIGIGPQFATTRLMDYFYEVQPQYAIPGRGVYYAHGGYLGSHLDISYHVPLARRFTLFTAAVPQIYSGATNQGSPLFKRKWGVGVALGISYSFFVSSRKAAGDVE